jgi:hypothetical protein
MDDKGKHMKAEYTDFDEFCEKTEELLMQESRQRANRLKRPHLGHLSRGDLSTTRTFGVTDDLGVVTDDLGRFGET